MEFKTLNNKLTIITKNIGTSKTIKKSTNTEKESNTSQIKEYVISHETMVYNPYSIHHFVPYNVKSQCISECQSPLCQSPLYKNHTIHSPLTNFELNSSVQSPLKDKYTDFDNNALDRQGILGNGNTEIQTRHSMISSLNNEFEINTTTINYISYNCRFLTDTKEECYTPRFVANTGNDIGNDPIITSEIPSIPLDNNKPENRLDLCKCCGADVVHLQMTCSLCEKIIKINYVCLNCVKCSCLNVKHIHHCILGVCEIEYTYHPIYKNCFLINGNNRNYIKCDKIRNMIREFMKCASMYKKLSNKDVLYDVHDLYKYNNSMSCNACNACNVVIDILEFCKEFKRNTYKLNDVMEWKLTKLRSNILLTNLACLSKLCQCRNIDSTMFINNCKEYVYYTKEFCPINPPVSLCDHDVWRCDTCVFRWKKNNNHNKIYIHTSNTNDYDKNDYIND